MPSKQFSRRELIDLLRLLRDRVGRTPVQRDTYDYPDIPSHGTYHNRFGSWRAALEAAGIPLDPANMGYDREVLLDRLRQVVDELGRVPKTSELGDLGGPVAPTYAEHFGSWTAALAELGLEPRTRQRYETQHLLEILRDLADELGSTPTMDDLRQREDLPCPRTFRYRFGGWRAALREAGLTPQYPTECRADAGDV